MTTNPTTSPMDDLALLPGLDYVANFLNALDTEEMTVNELRSVIYSECLQPGCKAILRSPIAPSREEEVGLADKSDHSPVGRLRWLLSETPAYEGDDPRAKHYRASRRALEAGIAALASTPPGSDYRSEEAENAQLRATIDRIRAAMEWVPPRNEQELDLAVAHDRKSLSLREMAKKHAVGVGVIRGSIARLDAAIEGLIGKGER